MKIVHTADWHLGHRLYEHSQYQEQQLFLNWLVTYIKENQVDMLLVSGDIFDTGTPSSRSLKMYYDFLINLNNSSCKHIVITGGNHDAPGTLNAPKELLNALSIKVVGKATEEIKDEIFKLKVDDDEVIVAAIPYLRDQDIRRAVEGESFEQISDRYKKALINHYSEAAEYCVKINDAACPIIAMGHLFAVDGAVSDSEQQIYVGNLGHIGEDDFPTDFNYIALGHLHRPQIVGSKEHIRYSGSPNVLSFSELGYEKNIVLLTTANNIIKTTEEIKVPDFRNISRIKGTPEDCIEQLQTISSNEYNLTPWVEIVLNNDSKEIYRGSEVYKAAEDLDVEIILLTLKKQRTLKGIEALLENTKHIKELSPLSVFEKKCAEQNFDLSENIAVLDAFNEVLQLAREN